MGHPPTLESPSAEDEHGLTASRRWHAVALGCLAALFLYLHLFQFPAVPIVRFGDQFYLLEHAERMLGGARMYRDLFQFNLPGTEYLYAALFRLFRPALWIAPLMLLLAGTASVLLLYSLARRALSADAALLPPLAVLVICLRSSLDGSHHWYSTALVLLAANLLAEHDVMRLSLAGACLGVTTLFTSSRGAFVVAAACAFLAWKLGRGGALAKSLAALLLPFAAVVGSALVYLGQVAGPRTLLDSVVVFPLRYYGAGAANNLSVYWDELSSALPVRGSSPLLIALWLAVNASVPIVFFTFFAGPFRRRADELRSSETGQHLVMMAMVGTAAMLAVCGAPSAPRLNCAAAAFAFFVGTAMLSRSQARRYIYPLLAIFIVLAVAEMGITQMRSPRELRGPRGAVALHDRDRYAQFEWLAQHARPGEALFGDAAMNFVLGLPNPAAVPFVEPNAYTRPEQVQSVVAALEQRRAEWVVWDEALHQSGGTGDALQALACVSACPLPPRSEICRRHGNLA